MLLEIDRAIAPVRHDDVAALPGHLVIGVRALASVDTTDLQALAGALAVLRSRSARRLGHVVPPSESPRIPSRALPASCSTDLPFAFFLQGPGHSLSVPPDSQPSALLASFPRSVPAGSG